MHTCVRFVAATATAQQANKQEKEEKKETHKRRASRIGINFIRRTTVIHSLMLYSNIVPMPVHTNTYTYCTRILYMTGLSFVELNDERT